MKLWIWRTYLSALLLVSSFFITGVLYFFWHNSEASSLALLNGYMVMKFRGTSFVEVQPGRYLLEDGPDSFRSKPFESHLSKWRWKFEEQMGAGLIYSRGDERMTAGFYSCGPGLLVVVLYNDAVTAETLKQPRPWTAFR
jgi:hypothetical protein